MTSPPSLCIKPEYNISTTPKLAPSSSSLDSFPLLPPLLRLSPSVSIAKPSLPASRMSSTADSEVSSHPALKLTVW
ncbi:hypothetical protein PGT21_009926 [Puccinia graminis f. sp. tritici]|uniref:Uncharacterized protein n=1 Tax=Puccinia graminis f. sp. tritici TaxID=56615 RepID=A0A5B0QF31_PUCGR|nr:hypothetical protein PGT21_009926 [Puccinia graminis f. sp. tritici]KAA1129466.1 hypothetical protein PGTUg99_010139 [Puccinia graminis f. sp. tritici]